MLRQSPYKLISHQLGDTRFSDPAPFTDRPIPPAWLVVIFCLLVMVSAAAFAIGFQVEARIGTIHLDLADYVN